MTTTTINEAFAGVGRMHARAYGSSGAFRHVGNASLLTLKQELDIQEQRDYTALGGGLAKRRARLKNVKADLTWLSFNTANLTLALAGTAAAVAEAAVTNEVVKGYKGSVTPLAAPPKAITAVNKVGVGTALAAGTDYRLSPGGIVWLEGGSITDGDSFEVDYTGYAHDRIEAAMKPATELEVFFEGLNDAEDGSPVIGNLWRCSFPPAAEIALIGEQMAELKFPVELLKDANRGSGTSGFFRVLKTPLGSVV